MKVAVLGAGAMGSALTVPLVDNDHEVALWATEYDRDIQRAIEAGRDHPRLDEPLPEAVGLFGPDGLEAAMRDASVVVLGVSSGGVLPVLERIAPHLSAETTLVTIAKGILELEDEPRLMHAGVLDALRDHGVEKLPEVACVAGPSIAAELAEKSPTAVDCAARDRATARRLAGVFGTDYFVLHPTDDVRGVEVCLGFKNVYAIALAWPSGLTERRHREAPSGMTNFKALLFLQIIRELKAMVRARGGDPATVDGLAGIGDLVTTSDAGRNGTLGRLLGGGLSAGEALEKLKEQGVGVVEGYESARPGRVFVEAPRSGEVRPEEMPLLEQVGMVLYEDRPVEDAIRHVPL